MYLLASRTRAIVFIALELVELAVSVQQRPSFMQPRDVVPTSSMKEVASNLGSVQETICSVKLPIVLGSYLTFTFTSVPYLPEEYCRVSTMHAKLAPFAT